MDKFIEKPESRTQDKVQSIEVIFMQLISYEKAGVVKFDQEDHDWQKAIRFAIEECSRRRIPNDKEPISGTSLCNLLNGNQTASFVAQMIELKQVGKNIAQNSQDFLKQLEEKEEETSEGISKEDKVKYIQEEIRIEPWI